MKILKTTIGRRSFLKTSTAAGGGLMLSFNWLVACQPGSQELADMPEEWFDMNGFLRIANNGMVTIMAPNPEIGQNVKTSMPMIVAEELDIDWARVIVEQAPLNTKIFTRQLAGGSQSIRQGWQGLRMAGAAARKMLVDAAAKEWNVPASEITTAAGTLNHASGKSAHYGEMAEKASILKVPEEVALKDVKDFKIIGTPIKNVDGPKIVTGQPLFGLDYKKDGMLIAMAIHPPAFGMKLKAFDGEQAKAMPGIKDVFKMQVYQDDYTKHMFDATAFNEIVVVVGATTWEVMQAKKQVEVEWEAFEGYEDAYLNFFSGSVEPQKVPGGLENTDAHIARMGDYGKKNAKVARRDGNPEAAFKKADRVIERTYTAPFLAHNTMEPMNFFADVKADYAELVGPIQTPEFMEQSASARLGLPLDKIEIKMTRMGGGFGRRLYGHFLVEAGIISQKMKAPVKLVYSREDDMSYGNYRPAYHAVYRAALDKNKQLIGFHVRAGGVPESPLFANRFPAGAIDNYLAEEWAMDSNISIGAFRAPRSNFIAGAEQAFIDELAEAMGKDPIEFRLELFEKAIQNPVGEENDYDAERYAEVLKLVRSKSQWNKGQQDVHRGVAAYYCHNSYVAHVLDVKMENGTPVVQNVTSAVDCGIVVNPISANNMIEGGVVDGIGHAMYSALTFKNGRPEQQNFDTYQLIRHGQAPKNVDVHFVNNEIDPTGLGEPPFPPIMGAMANALYKATGKRYYHQPFMNEKFSLG